MEYYSVIIKNAIMPFEVTWRDIEVFILSEVRQRKTNFIWYHLYVESNFFKWHKMNLFTKKKQSYRYQKTNKLNGYQMGNLGGGGINQVLGTYIYSLLYIW